MFIFGTKDFYQEGRRKKKVKHLKFFIIFKKKIEKKDPHFPFLITDFEMLGLQMVSFTLKQLKTATNNFDNVNKIGEGGFGPVYRVCISDFGFDDLYVNIQYFV